MHQVFEDAEAEGAILVDATNAFNCLNHQTALFSVKHLCPALLKVLINTYRAHHQLFNSLTGGHYTGISPCNICGCLYLANENIKVCRHNFSWRATNTSGPDRTSFSKINARSKKQTMTKQNKCSKVLE